MQSMTNTLTTDIIGTIKQINEIQNEGADIVRVSCPDEDSTKALKEITKKALEGGKDGVMQIKHESKDNSN